jgi:hypothetical protein
MNARRGAAVEDRPEDVPIATLDAEIANIARVALSSETPRSREEFDELRKTVLRPMIEGGALALGLFPAMIERFDEMTSDELLDLVRDDEERLAADLAEKTKRMPKRHARLFAHLSANALRDARRIDGVGRLIRDVRAPRVRTRARERKPRQRTRRASGARGPPRRASGSSEDDDPAHVAEAT